MPIELHHTIVWCRDHGVSADFLTELFDLPTPVHSGPFMIVELGNGVSLDYHEIDGPISPQHYAFRVSDDEFDAIFDRMLDAGVEHWADPAHHESGRINHADGSRSVYFEDPDGHSLEIITTPHPLG